MNTHESDAGSRRFGPFDAVVFDTDGVITRTAEVHRASWKRLFDDFLAERSGGTARPFSDEDYLAYVDGLPRFDGVARFLASRSIELPQGDRSDPSDAETVCGLGNRKNSYFRSEVQDHGVQVYESTVELVSKLTAAGVKVAAVSASENQRLVLDTVGLVDSFEVLVDGVAARDLNLAGKPDPALFLEAARQLGVGPARTVVVEDARSGVAAGRAGGFGVVIGVNRGRRPQELRDAGADFVVDDLDEVSFDASRGERWFQVR